MGRSRRTLHAALDASAVPPAGLAPTQSLARVVQAEGNSLYTCVLPPGSASSSPSPSPPRTPGRVLVELNARFRNNVFLRRGGYVLVDLVEAGERAQAGRRVVGEIVAVVLDEKAWRKKAYWPAAFAKITYDEPDDDDDDDDDDSLVGKLPPSDSEDESTEQDH